MYDVVALGELLIDFVPVSADEAGYPTPESPARRGAGKFSGGIAAAARFACCAASLSTQAHGGITSIVPEEKVLKTV